MSFRHWIELESDPGLFSLLVYDFGVKGVEVEEVYDLTKPMERSVLGFIFLFKWTEERKTRRKAVVTEENFVFDETIENDMFFAQQLIPNSCASHALLSVLLNVPDVSLGYTLKQLRDSCKGFDSETKGHAIGNFWNIAVAHNNHGRPELRWHADRLKNVTASRSMEAFHYVSYIPYNGRLFELDGLKPHPIDHGPWSSDETWSDKARKVIQGRILLATGGELSHDIRYNLLAVVPEQRDVYKEKMEILNHNKKVLIEVFKKLACKETFACEPPSNTILKQTDTRHPFPDRKLYKKKKKGKSVSFMDNPRSPHSSSSSTLTGNESIPHLLSDSEDSSVDTYRIKSIIRGKPPFVYVYGEGDETLKEVKNANQNESTEKENGVTEENKKYIGEKRKIDDVECATESDDGVISKQVKHEQSSQETPIDDKELKGKQVTDILEKGIEEPSDLKINLPSMPCSRTLSPDQFSVTDDKSTRRVESPVKQLDNTSLSQVLISEIKVEKEGDQDFECNEENISEFVKGTDTLDKSMIDVKIKRELDEIMHYEEDLLSENIQSKICSEDMCDDDDDDDIDIETLLGQKNITKLSLGHVLKYEDRITLPHLQKCMQDLDELYKSHESSYKEELDKIERYKIDDCRRRHNYEPFVATFLSMLADQGHLTKLLEDQNNSNVKRLTKGGTVPKKEIGNKKNKKMKKK